MEISSDLVLAVDNRVGLWVGDRLIKELIGLL